MTHFPGCGQNNGYCATILLPTNAAADTHMLVPTKLYVFAFTIL